MHFQTLTYILAQQLHLQGPIKKPYIIYYNKIFKIFL